MVSCWLLHPSRNLGCREPMMLLSCGCSQPAASGMLRHGTLRGPASSTVYGSTSATFIMNYEQWGSYGMQGRW